MIHFTCDRCGRVLEIEEDLRYIVNLEICVAMDPLEVNEIDEDRDHLLEIHEILEGDESREHYRVEMYTKQRYDLCPECQKKFMGNPLGREPAPQLGFSQN